MCDGDDAIDEPIGAGSDRGGGGEDEALEQVRVEGGVDVRTERAGDAVPKDAGDEVHHPVLVIGHQFAGLRGEQRLDGCRAGVGRRGRQDGSDRPLGRPAAGATVTATVVLADDQELVRAGFRVLLELDGDIEVVGEAADGEQAVRTVAAVLPDVVVMDMRMPGVDGLEATRRILADRRTRSVHVLVLSTFDTVEYVSEALRLGSSGFLLKDTDPGELRRAVRTTVARDALLSPAITKRVIAEFAHRSSTQGQQRPDNWPGSPNASVRSSAWRRPG